MFVQTYTLSSTAQGGVSDIIYFTTLPTTPTHPREVQVKALNDFELKVTWLPPNKPNGNVTHYMVYWQPQPYNRAKLDKRNYCIQKLQFKWKATNEIEQSNKEAQSNATRSENCCLCPKSEEEKEAEEEERQMEIEFQNFLQDTVYIKRPPQKIVSQGTAGKAGTFSSSSVQVRRRRRRNINDVKMQNLMQAGMQGMALNSSYFEGINITGLLNMSLTNETEEEEATPYLAQVVYKPEVVLSNLRHFQEYNIEVIACHDPQEDGSTEKQCSNRAITTGRTHPKVGADNLSADNLTITQDRLGSDVKLKWPDPWFPNGLIVSYEIEYQNSGIRDSKMVALCIPHIEYRKVGGYIIPMQNINGGNYSFRIRATSLAGNGTWTNKKYFMVLQQTTEMMQQPTLIILPVLLVAFLLIVVGILAALYMYRKRVSQGMPEGVLYASVNPEYISAGDMYVPDEWEVPRDKIKLGRELGQGSFGMVHEGIAKDILQGESELKVAVKTVNLKATIRDRINFLNEASVMKAFKCNHVVKLLGVVSKGQPTMVIMELMAFGDLKYFLRLHRPDEEDDNEDRRPPTLKQILEMAAEVADGMAYLAGKKYVHRDLAARNCMVSADNIVKVGDFGMTRDIYETDYYREGGRGLLPVRWMAPESLRDGKFNPESDVWSFGVVLWEMATLAAQPYQGLSNEQVLKYVIDGGVMQHPHGCPERLYDMMLLCWRHKAKHRPTFGAIVNMLESEISQSFKDRSYYYSEERINHEREKEREKERELAEDVAMNAAQANAIGPEDFHPGEEGEEDDSNDVTTPLTGSPVKYNNRDLSVLDDSTQRILGSSKHSLNSLDSKCSHRHPCQCSEKDSTGGSTQFHLNGLKNGHIPRAYIAEKC